MDPAFRDRAPREIVDERGKQRLVVEGRVFGSPDFGIASTGMIDLRERGVPPDKWTYADGRKGGFDPDARIIDMEIDAIDAAFLYPTLGLYSGAFKDPALAAA